MNNTGPGALWCQWLSQWLTPLNSDSKTERDLWVQTAFPVPGWFLSETREPPDAGGFSSAQWREACGTFSWFPWGSCSSSRPTEGCRICRWVCASVLASYLLNVPGAPGIPVVTHNEDVGVLVIPGTLRKSSKRSSGLTRIPMGAALTPSPVGLHNCAFDPWTGSGLWLATG